MTTEEALNRDVARGLRAIAPFGPDIVVCGGWVPRFYRTLQAFDESTRSAAMSLDLDLVVPRPLPGADLAAVFRSNELVAVASRDREPPVVRWQGREFGDEDLAPVHIDLLTPLVGSAVGRDGEDKTVPEVQKHLRASAIRRLELLLFEPIPCDASAIAELHLPRPTMIFLPNPLCYVLQKLLSAPTRQSRAKQHKDLAYVYDVVLLSRPLWPDMRGTLERVRSKVPNGAAWAIEASLGLDRDFSAPEGAATDIARQLAVGGPALSPEAIWRAIVVFQREVGI